MRLGFTHKLLLALLAANIVLITIMATASQWNFQRGFLNYLHQVELQELDGMARALTDAYRQEQSWGLLERNHTLWHNRFLLHLSNTPELTEPPPPLRARRPDGRDRQLTPPPPPAARGGDRSSLGSRISLYDANGTHIIGPPSNSDEALERPITLEGETVAWLRLTPLPWLDDSLEQQFRDQQRNALYLTAIAALLLSLLVSIPLGRHLLQPVKHLITGARALAAGDYETRIDIAQSDELGQLSHDFNLLAEALERNEQLRRQGMADVSHELRTPLSVLRAEIEAMQDGVRPIASEQLATLHDTVMGLSRLVDDLYELALSDTGALDYHRLDLELTTLLEQCIESATPMLTEKALLIESEIGGEIALLADERRLRQVFANLLKNSARYTDAGGRVSISCQQLGNRAVIDIQDSAPRVDDKLLPRLFDRFYRVESSRNRARGGAGLGLAITKEIVEAHGGNITAQRSPLGGLWIEITLPVSS